MLVMAFCDMLKQVPHVKVITAQPFGTPVVSG